MSLLNLLITTISLLVVVAFYTILERKILSYIQIRKGPNSVGLMGLLQPFSDAIKLFNKNLISMENSNLIVFYLTPLLSLFLALILISILPFMKYPPLDNKHNILMLFIISSMSVYILLMIGWTSNSKYAHMGSIRNVAQMISYEVSFFLIILFIAMMSNSYYFTQISDSHMYISMIWGNLILFYFWMISSLAEVNRSPFDFAEGESELVSGFNVEFMGGWFALIFLAEYTNMIILMLITTVLFFSKIKTFTSMLILMTMTIMLLWIRGTYPRFRYDFLMLLSWKIILPSILFLIPLSIISTYWF